MLRTVRSHLQVNEPIQSKSTLLFDILHSSEPVSILVGKLISEWIDWTMIYSCDARNCQFEESVKDMSNFETDSTERVAFLIPMTDIESHQNRILI